MQEGFPEGFFPIFLSVCTSVDLGFGIFFCAYGFAGLNSQLLYPCPL